METLENKIENSFLEKIKDYLVGKVVLYSLAGVLGAGLGAGCEGDTGSNGPNSSGPNGSNPSVRYSCSNGQCVKDSNGPYAVSDCNNACTEIIERSKRYFCLAGECIEDPNGAYLFSDCNNACVKETEQVCWDKTFGGNGTDRANSIQQTTDGGYIVAGETESKGAGGSDVWVFKLDPNGDVEWDIAFGGSGWEEAYSIQQTTDGGYIVVGERQSGDDHDAWVLKLDSNGNLDWDKTFGEWAANSIQQTTDGGYIVAGETGSDAWILKLDSNGNLEWDKTFGGSNWDGANSIQQTTDGGYIVAGETESKGAGLEDAWVLKLNSDGSLPWDNTFGGSGDDKANSIQQTTDGEYIVAGRTKSKGAGEWDAWVFKLDSTGNLEWDKAFGGSDGDFARSIQQIKDGKFVVAGETASKGAGAYDTWVFKLDPNGDLEWDKTFGGSGWDHADSIQQTTDGGYIVAGETGSKGAGKDDGWILKLDKDGNLECK